MKQMMKQLFAALIALLMMGTLALAETTGPDHTAEITLEANPTTGYAWTAFILGGDAVTIDSPEGTYVQDPNPESLVGVGGHTTFVITAVQPGESLIRFTYSRGWEEGNAEVRYILVVVEDDLVIYTLDVTEAGVITGTVTSVDADAYTALVHTELQGEVVVTFDGDLALPVEGEQVVIFTNGTMTMSLPPIMNAIAWESVPGADARAE